MNPYPHSYSELALIGAALLRPDCLQEIAAEIDPSEFHGPNRIIYKTLVEMLHNNIPIEIGTLYTELQRKNRLHKAGGKNYLFEIAEAAVTTSSVSYHISVLKEKSTHRKLQSFLVSTFDKLKHNTPIDDILSDFKDLIANVHVDPQTNVISMLEGIKHTFTEIESARNSGQLTGIPSGFTDIDSYTGGWQPGELIVIAGRPGMGKSALVKHFAENSGVPTLYFTLEMSYRDIIKRQLAANSNVNFNNIRLGSLSDQQWNNLIKAANSLAKLPIYFVDIGYLTIDQLLSITKYSVTKYNIGLVIIDYLQLLKKKTRIESREQEIADISRKLKNLAKEHNIPLICVAQLNRKCEERLQTRKRPILSDLRESGAIEQDADIVAFLYRENLYYPDANENQAEFILAKGRNIKIGTIDLYWDGSHQCFRNFHPGTGEGG